MKFLRVFLVLLIIPFFSAASPPLHKFYVSITKIEYVKEKNSIQIIAKIFTDDMENALRKRYDRSISLDTKKETESVDEDLKKYILQKIKIKINGKPVQVNYVGKEYDMDMVVAYMEVIDVRELKSIDIENTVLMELFPEQQNIIHLKTSKSRRSLILDRDDPRGKLKFN